MEFSYFYGERNCFVTKSCPTLVTPWAVACQRQEYWSELPFPSPGDLPDPGIEHVSTSLADGFLPLNHQESWEEGDLNAIWFSIRCFLFKILFASGFPFRHPLLHCVILEAYLFQGSPWLLNCLCWNRIS